VRTIKVALVIVITLISVTSLNTKVYADGYLPNNRLLLAKISITELQLAVEAWFDRASIESLLVPFTAEEVKLVDGAALRKLTERCASCGAVPGFDPKIENTDKELSAQAQISSKIHELTNKIDAAKRMYAAYSNMLKSAATKEAAQQLTVPGRIKQLQYAFDDALKTERDLRRISEQQQFIPEVEQRQRDILAEHEAVLKDVVATSTEVRELKRRMLDSLLLIDRLNLLIINETNRRDSAGCTVLARSLIYQNKDLATLLLRYQHEPGSNRLESVTRWEAEGSLSKELLKASAGGDAERVRRLLEEGAGVDQPSGSWNGLAYSKALGHNKINRLLSQAGAVLRVPWNKELGQDMKEKARVRLNILEDQLNRVQSFASSVRYEKAQSFSNSEQILQVLKCKINCLRRHFLEPQSEV
jgi:hypothetical protein